MRKGGRDEKKGGGRGKGEAEKGESQLLPHSLNQTFCYGLVDATVVQSTRLLRTLNNLTRTSNSSAPEHYGAVAW